MDAFAFLAVSDSTNLPTDSTKLIIIKEKKIPPPTKIDSMKEVCLQKTGLHKIIYININLKRNFLLIKFQK